MHFPSNNSFGYTIFPSQQNKILMFYINGFTKVLSVIFIVPMYALILDYVYLQHCFDIDFNVIRNVLKTLFLFFAI